MQITMQLSLLNQHHWTIIRKGVYHYECRLLQAQMNPSFEGTALETLISKHETLCDAWTSCVLEAGRLGLPYYQ
jgi:hypothetical protein